MKLKRMFVLAAVLATTAQIRAGWYGNLGKPAERGQTTVAGMVEFGSRELETDSGTSQDVDTSGITLQVDHGFGHGIAAFGRVAPQTLKWDFDNTNFEPELLAFGAGLKWAPEGQSGPVKFGLGLGLDWATGDDESTDIDVKEYSLAGGVGYAIDKNLDLYGGVSLISTDVEIESSGTTSDLEEDTPFGLFGGIDFRLNEKFSLGAEVRLLNEQVFSLAARFSFGK